MVQSETKAAEFIKAWKKRYRDPPGVDATARDFLGLKYVRDGPVIAISCHKAIDDLAEKLSGLGPRQGAGAQCASPLHPGFLNRLESSAGPDNAPLPDSALPQARSTLGLAGWAV